MQILQPDGTRLNSNKKFYGPDVMATLVSLSQITKLICAVLFGEDGEAGAYVCRAHDNNVMFPAKLTTDSICVIDVSTPLAVAMFAQPAETAGLWRRHMRHRR